VRANEALNRPRDKASRVLFDKEVKAQAQASEAEAQLRSRIRTSFPHESRAILESMLSFNPKNRPSAKEAAQRWREALSGWAQPTGLGGSATTAPQIRDAKAEVEAYLRAFIRREVGMSTVQWQRICKSIDDLQNRLEPSQLQDLRELQSQARLVREKVQDSAETLRRTAQSSASSQRSSDVLCPRGVLCGRKTTISRSLSPDGQRRPNSSKCTGRRDRR